MCKLCLLNRVTLLFNQCRWKTLPFFLIIFLYSSPLFAADLDDQYSPIVNKKDFLNQLEFIYFSLDEAAVEAQTAAIPPAPDRHGLPNDHVVRARSILGGLHHEYWLEKMEA